jgi:hypothetical protein
MKTLQKPEETGCNESAPIWRSTGTIHACSILSGKQLQDLDHPRFRLCVTNGRSYHHACLFRPKFPEPYAGNCFSLSTHPTSCQVCDLRTTAQMGARLGVRTCPFVGTSCRRSARGNAPRSCFINSGKITECMHYAKVQETPPKNRLQF